MIILAGYKKGKAIKLSYHFKTTELDCNGKGCCSTTLIDKELVVYLERIRIHFGKPVIINSGYRCGRHNKAVGGAKYSKHTLGKAADIVVKGVPTLKVAQYCEAIGIKGIGHYETFVHIDTRTKKSFWYSSNQQYRSTFGTYKSLRQVAEDVIDGKYGNGADRKKKIEALGFDYKEVQALVNDLLRK